MKEKLGVCFPVYALQKENKNGSFNLRIVTRFLICTTKITHKNWTIIFVYSIFI